MAQIPVKLLLPGSSEQILKSNPSTTWGEQSSLSNLLLNPSFDTVLFGTHTSAGFQLASAGATKNSPLPGWMLFTNGGGSPSYDFEQVDATIDSRTGRFGRITVNTLANNGGVYQPWNAGQLLTSFLKNVRGKYITFSMDLRPSHASVSVRLFVYFDGTGAAYSYSTAVTGTTSWTRAICVPTVVVPDDCTVIEYRVEVTAINAGGNTVHCDNGMVIASDQPLNTLPFMPRPPITIFGIIDPYGPNAGGFDFAILGPDGDSGAWFASNGSVNQAWDVNASRPHFANLMGVHLEMYDNSVYNSLGFLRAAGRTNAARGFTGCVPGLGYSYHQLPFLEIGQDGQFEAYLNTATVYMWLARQHWIGVNL